MQNNDTINYLTVLVQLFGILDKNWDSDAEFKADTYERIKKTCNYIEKNILEIEK